MKLYTLLRKMKVEKEAKAIQGFLTNQLIFLKKVTYKNHLKSYNRDEKDLKILISSYDGGIGNTVEATSSVIAARTLWPNAKICFLTKTPELFDQWCVPDTIISSLKSLEGFTFDLSFFAYYGYHKLPQWVNKYNLGIIHYPKIWLNAYFLKPEREYNVDMLRKYGFNGKTPPPYVNTSKPEIEIADSEFRIALLPCAKNTPEWENKRWPYYAELASILLKKHKNCQILIIGKAEDQIEGNLPDNRRLTDLRDKLSLSETAWLLKNSDLCIGNDCGPAHIAGAVNTKNIIIYGPTCPIKNRPFSNSKAIYSKCLKMPCQYRATICKHADCMKIDTKKIIELIENNTELYEHKPVK